MKKSHLMTAISIVLLCCATSCDDGESGNASNLGTCREVGTLSCAGNDLMMCTIDRETNEKVLVSGAVVACQSGKFYSCKDGNLTEKTCKTSCIVAGGIARCMDCKNQNECKGEETCSGGKCQKGDCQVQCELNDRVCVNNTNQWKLCQDVMDDGCYTWSTAVECQPGEKCVAGYCRNESSLESCDDDCSAPDVSECVGTDGYRTCTEDENGCLKWSETTNCSSGELCTTSSGKASCYNTTECTSDCDIQGERKCAGKGYKECIKVGNCTVWSDVTDCPEGESCQEGGSCDKAAQTCENKCTKDATQCAGEKYMICTDTNDDGCVEWSEARNCPTGQTCSSSSNACEAPAINEPVRYLYDDIHSPITPYTVKQLKNIAAKNTTRNNHSFMKLGDSHMAYESLFVKCFSDNNTGASYEVTLDSHTDLADAIAAFQSEGFDSFDRQSECTKIGEFSTYPINNSFARLNTEIAATNPRFAFYGFGSNDLGMYGYNKEPISGGNQGYYYTMEWFYRNVISATEKMIENGIIPIFIGISPKEYDVTGTNAVKPKYFVSTFNTILRGVAENYQLPFMNLQKVLLAVDGYGLSSDGKHLNSATSACDLTPSGLTKGMNNRNLYSMEMLNRAWNVVVNDQPAPDSTGETFKGSGSPSDPWIISSLPFSHSADTSKSPNSLIKTYDCTVQKNEYGAEYYYKLVISSPTKIRTFVASDTGVDVDIYLVKDTNGKGCVNRNDKGFEATLNPGTYYIIIDTFSGTSGTTKPGRYLFGIHQCDADDSTCG